MHTRDVVLAVSVVVLSIPAAAHHSTAMFDRGNPATLTGTVKEYLWRNPHSMLVLDVQRVTNGKGEAEAALAGVWQVELHSTGILLRRGWTKDFFTVGETVTVTGGRMADGSRMIRLDRGTKTDGSKFYGDDFSPEATGNNLEPQGQR